MAGRFEVNFACPGTDDPAIHHAAISSWDVDEAVRMAEKLPVPCVGFRFSTWDGDVLTAHSQFYVFGRTAKSAIELSRSDDPKERRLVEAAARDGMRRIFISDTLALSVRNDAVFLPELKKG